MACLGEKRQHLAPKPNSSFFNGVSAGPFEKLRIVKPPALPGFLKIYVSGVRLCAITGLKYESFLFQPNAETN